MVICVFVSLRFLEHPDLKCGLQRLTSAFPRGFGLFPTVHQLLRPWTGVDSAWDSEPSQFLKMCPEPVVSHILLSPASGEQFDITIQLLDQLLNLATATVTLQVCTFAIISYHLLTDIAICACLTLHGVYLFVWCTSSKSTCRQCSYLL